MAKVIVSALASVLVLSVAAPGVASPELKGSVGSPRYGERYQVTALPGPFFDGHGRRCSDIPPNGVNQHLRSFEAPGAGRLVVDLDGFIGDWDLYLQKGEVESYSSQSGGATETASMSVRKGQIVDVVACNWAGGPIAQVTVTFEKLGGMRS